MRTRTLSVSRACQQACLFCDVAAQLDRAPVPADGIKAAIDAAKRDGFEQVVFSGGEPTVSAHGVKALAYANGLGLRTVLATNARVLHDPGIHGRLRAVGVDEVWIALHGATPEVHNRLVGGDPWAWTQATRALEALRGFTAVRIRTVLTRLNEHEIEDLLELAAAWQVAFELRALGRRGRARERWAELALTPAQRWEVARRAQRRAQALGVALRLADFGGEGLHGADPLPPAGATPQEADEALRQGLLGAHVLGGVRADDSLPALAAARRLSVPQLGLLWAAQHAPVLDLPAEAGGLGPADPALPRPTAWTAARRVDVVVTRLDTPLAALSSLPALVLALRARGVDARLHTPFPDSFDPHVIPPPEVARGLGRLGAGLRQLVRGQGLPSAELAEPDRPEHQALLRRFLDGLDLRGADTVVVWGDPAGLRGRLGPGVRLEVVEDRPLCDPEPPGPRDVLRSPFAALAPLHVAAGVPLHQVHHRPLPIHAPHVRPASGRGRDLLVVRGPADDPALVAVLPAGARTLTALPAPSALRDALSGVRAVVLPWQKRPEPPEVIWLSLALAARIPVVAPEVLTVTDHVRDGVEGLLLRPGDADGLRDALAALADDVLVDRLSCGRRAVEVEAWADELAQGASPTRLFPLHPGHGPWYPW